MNITLTGTLLRIQWKPYAPDIEAEIVRRLQTIPGVMKNRDGSCWYVHIKHLDSLMDLFPSASYDPAAWEAWRPAHWVFYEMLVRMGVELAIGPMEAVFSPSLPKEHVLQELIAERGEALKRLMDQAQHPTGATPAQAAPSPVGADIQPTLLDRSIFNAAQTKAKEDRLAEVRGRNRYHRKGRA